VTYRRTGPLSGFRGSKATSVDIIFRSGVNGYCLTTRTVYTSRQGDVTHTQAAQTTHLKPKVCQTQRQRPEQQQYLRCTSNAQGGLPTTATPKGRKQHVPAPGPVPLRRAALLNPKLSTSNTHAPESMHTFKQRPKLVPLRKTQDAKQVRCARKRNNNHLHNHYTTTSSLRTIKHSTASPSVLDPRTTAFPAESHVTDTVLFTDKWSLSMARMSPSVTTK
jgi:hypothetical protein